MEKFELDRHMVESIEYMREDSGLSLFGTLREIVNEGAGVYDADFGKHSKKILDYFNDFDDREDDENFMKCILGHYKVKLPSKDEILEKLSEIGVFISENSWSIEEGKHSGYVADIGGKGKGIVINLQ